MQPQKLCLFVKTGGLADVAGSLPKELKQKVQMFVVVIPKYSGIKEEYRNNMVTYL